MTSPLTFFKELFQSTLAFVSTYTVDVVVVGILFLLLSWFALRYGKGRIIALILALYVALLTFTYFPYQGWFRFLGEGERQVLLSKGGIFLLMVVIVTLVLSRSISGEFPFWGIMRTLEVSLLSGSATLLLLSFWYQVLPFSGLYTFGAPIASLFGASQLFFWWLLIPLGVIFALSRR